MGMHQSWELAEVASVLFEQLLSHYALGSNQYRCWIAISDEQRGINRIWSTDAAGQPLNTESHIPINDHPIQKRIYKAWKKGEAYIRTDFTADEAVAYTSYLTQFQGYDEDAELISKIRQYKKVRAKSQLKRRKTKEEVIVGSMYEAFFKNGRIGFLVMDKLVDLDMNLFVRFAKVFEQTYTRFLDLQKAETQALEAQIEAALERVRAASMAMHHTSELQHVINVVGEQFRTLEIDNTGGVFICINDEIDQEICVWGSGGTANYVQRVSVPMLDRPIYTEIVKKVKAGPSFITESFSREEKVEFFKHMFKYPPYNKTSKAHQKERLAREGGYTRSCAISKHTTLFMINHHGRVFSEDENNILKRFGRVFEQTYTRFLDLKKAEAQAREAQIEAALERVRAKAMAMHHSSELHEAAAELFDQMKHLGANPFGCGFVLCDKDDPIDRQWMYVPDAGRFITQYMPHDREPVHKDMYKGWLEKKEIHAEVVEGRRMERMVKFLNSQPSFKDNISQFESKGIEMPMWQKLHAAYFSHGYLLIITLEDFPETDIFVRCAKVFEQTYTRFLDLQKAEAQAREAQIEAALERVRARMMAMHKSDELRTVIASVFEQLQDLGFERSATSLGIYDNDLSSEHWFTGFTHEVLPKSYKIPYCRHKHYQAEVIAWKKGMEFDELVFKGKAKVTYAKWLFEHSDFGKLPPEFKKEMLDLKPTFVSNAYMKYGFMEVLGNCPLDPESVQILKRFAAVFEQTYTRFLDLQKAEAQAREAQIEAALERVRAKAMAMHSSADLTETIKVFYNQIGALTNIPRRCGVAIIDEKERVSEVWTMNTTEEGESVDVAGSIKMEGHSVLENVFTHWKNQEDYFPILRGKEITDYYKVLHPQIEFPDYPHDEVQYGHYFMFPEGDVYAWTEEELREDDLEIYRRFTSVLSLTYRRYFDLQRAEAQAQEAQIEVALERVRAVSLAMHQSEELQKVITTVFDQLKSLDISMDVSFIEIFDHTHDTNMWVANPQHEYAQLVRVPYFKNPLLDRMLEARRRKETFFNDHYGRGVKNRFYRKVFKDSDLSVIPPKLQEEILRRAGYARSVALTKHAALAIFNLDDLPYREDENLILRRFSKVFEQAYTRFLDLERVEAQAREAEIQLALERIRARSLAMHKSEELSDVISELFKQFDILEINPAFAHLTLFDGGDEWFTLRLTDTSGDRVMAEQRINLKHIPEWIEAYHAWKDGKEGEVGIIPYRSEDLPFVFGLMKDLIKAMPAKSRIKAKKYPDGLWTVQGHCQFGYLGMNITRSPTDEDKDIVRRFAREFGRVYLRFIDLQNAEAQTREAQIEAALERVRSQTMAMHRSDELLEIVHVVHDELEALGLEMDVMQIYENQLDQHSFNAWMAVPGKPYPAEIRFPYFDHPWLRKMRRAQEQRETFSDIITKRSKNTFYRKYFELASIAPSPKRQKLILDAPAVTYAITFLENTGLGIVRLHEQTFTEEELSILQRFASVFEQTYTRFLDLQKAEAQTREAQIEAALERVRSVSLAMHTSEELHKVITVMFDQLNGVGVRMDAAMIVENIPDSRDWYMWLAVPSDAVGGYVRVQRVHVPYLRNPSFTRLEAARKKNKSFLVDFMTKSQKDAMFRHYFTNSNHTDVPRKRKNYILSGDGLCRSVILSKSASIQLFRYSKQAFNEVENDLIRRFAKVFEQTYTRFLDLQKAEEQAREAQIEAGLERIRASAMAMHSSEDLIKVAKVLREQMGQLGQPELESSIIHLYPESGDTFEAWWVFRPPDDTKGQVREGIAVIPKRQSAWARAVVERYRSDKTEYVILSKGKMLTEWYKQLEEIAPATIDYDRNGKIIVPKQLYYYFSKFSGGALLLITSDEPDRKSCELQRRAAGVFDLAYTRFLDLQKAEAQAREAEIEAALERVRTRTMAMHSSQDISDTTIAMFNELESLGISTVRCGVLIMREKRHIEVWAAASREGRTSLIAQGRLDTTIHPLIQGIYENWDQKAGFYEYDLEGEDLITYYQALRNANYDIDLPDKLQPRLTFRVSFFPEGGLFSFSIDPLSTEASQIFSRFAGVFGLTYRRYLDLQKAESQAREAKIEAALERIRNAAMLMTTPNDLMNVVRAMREQMEALKEPGLETTVVQLWDDELEISENWYSFKMPGDLGAEVVEDIGLIPKYSTAYARAVTDHYSKGTREFTVTSDHEMLVEWYGVLEEIAPRVVMYDNKGKLIVPDELHYHYSRFEGGALVMVSEELPRDTAKILLRRAARVFNLAYQRFIDLQKAEAQAREAQIEAALERVRSRTMAMHDSEDIGITAAALFDELVGLGISKKVRCGIGILNETEVMELWTASSSVDTGVDLNIGYLEMTLHPLLSGVRQAWIDKKKSFSYELRGDDLFRYFEVINSAPDYPVQIPLDSLPPLVFHHSIMFTNGVLFAFAEEPLPEDVSNTLKRFAVVFGQTYQRYVDLQNAEDQAREATKNAAIDRVRAEIASMRTTEDLQRITPLIWRELTTLEVPFIRCGVFIIDDESETTRTYLSTPGGKSLAVMDLGFDNPLVRPAVEQWRQNRVYKEEWDKKQFIEWTQALIDQGVVKSSKKYQGGGDAPEHLVLHFVPFTQGMMYVGSPDFLDENQIELVEALADAFAVAYARYEDFTQLEAAKGRVEGTLDELKSAQNQLIHAEKMASLGELTAGIAHEIQNPLNFVNNFSDVNSELIDEMLEEIKAGNYEEAKEIAQDIEGNEQKIKDHGKRAEAIVRSMLQHSRSSSDQKELTDINSLADEYLRLAYHGMRAKDKSFNASMKTDFDPSLKKVEIVPQEIGRVLLNLITNAFHACQERSLTMTSDRIKPGENGYVPEVLVATRFEANRLQISVKDNGGGIPKKILDKIFQPFFTTKPTGQGTGLGLSLSYDIVKVHNGELKVETEEGEGTEFVIELPIAL
ncbi:MAG: ATP-binding protein [Saprospiraceae bacterium]|nr:ATP-binding protein [Saprospiraceae bacterium]